jgi:flagellar basal-body rod protein FlgF
LRRAEISRVQPIRRAGGKKCPAKPAAIPRCGRDRSPKRPSNGPAALWHAPCKEVADRNEANDQTMQAAAYIALSSQMALHRQMDVVANNLANASTPSFKAERMLFSEFLNRGSASQPLSFVQDLGTVRDTKQGPITRTGNSLDIALRGDGYLSVQTPLGVRYTRNGHFQLDGTGQVVTAQGYPVLGDGGNPLTVPTNASDITVTRDGTVSTEQGDAGRIGVVSFANERDLVPASGGFYVTEAQPVPASNTVVLQGMIEESNVEPIVEMTRMMNIAHNFSFAKDLGDSENDRTRSAIEKLGKVA